MLGDVMALFSQHFAETSELQRQPQGFAGKTLQCQCGLEQPCHADVIIKAFENKRVEQVAQPAVFAIAQVSCGSAGLAEACQDKGSSALAVDWTGKKHKPSPRNDQAEPAHIG